MLTHRNFDILYKRTLLNQKYIFGFYDKRKQMVRKRQNDHFVEIQKTEVKKYVVAKTNQPQKLHHIKWEQTKGLSEFQPFGQSTAGLYPLVETRHLQSSLLPEKFIPHTLIALFQMFPLFSVLDSHEQSLLTGLALSSSA